MKIERLLNFFLLIYSRQIFLYIWISDKLITILMCRNDVSENVQYYCFRDFLILFLFIC